MASNADSKRAYLYQCKTHDGSEYPKRKPHSSNAREGQPPTEQQCFVAARPTSHDTNAVKSSPDVKVKVDQTGWEECMEVLWTVCGRSKSGAKCVGGCLKKYWQLLSALVAISCVVYIFVYSQHHEDASGIVQNMRVQNITMDTIPHVAFVPLTRNEIDLDFLETLWRRVALRVSFLNGYYAKTIANDKFKLTDANTLRQEDASSLSSTNEESPIKLAEKSQMKQEDDLNVLRNTSSIWLTDCVTNMSKDIEQYANTLVGYAHLQATITRVEVGNYPLVALKQKIKECESHLSSLSMKNTVIDWGATTMNFILTCFCAMGVCVSISKQSATCAFVCICICLLSNVAFGVYSSSTLLTIGGRVNVVVQPPTGLSAFDLTVKVEELLTVLVDNYDGQYDLSMTEDSFFPCLDGAKTITKVMDANAKTPQKVFSVYANLVPQPKTCDCQDGELGNWLEALETSIPPPPPPPASVPISSPYDAPGGYTADHAKGQCTNAKKLACVVQNIWVFQEGEAEMSELCSSVALFMSYPGVRTYLQPKNDHSHSSDPKVVKRHDWVKFLSDLWHSCKNVKRASLYMRSGGGQTIKSASVVWATSIFDQIPAHNGFMRGHESAVIDRMNQLKQHHLELCKDHAEDLYKAFLLQKFPGIV